MGYSSRLLGFSFGLLGFSSRVMDFSSGVLGFRSGLLGFSSGLLAVSSRILGFKAERQNDGPTKRRSNGTTREEGGALAPPFEHLVYICLGKGLAGQFAVLGIPGAPRGQGRKSLF